MLKCKLIRLIFFVVSFISCLIMFWFMPSLIFIFDFILTHVLSLLKLFDCSWALSLIDKIPTSIVNFYSNYVNFLFNLAKLNFNLLDFYNSYIYLFDLEFIYNDYHYPTENYDFKKNYSFMMENNNNNQLGGNNDYQGNTIPPNPIESLPIMQEYWAARDKHLSGFSNIVKYFIAKNTTGGTLLILQDQYNEIINNKNSNEGEKLFAFAVVVALENAKHFRAGADYNITQDEILQIFHGLADGNSIPHIYYPDQVGVSVYSHRVVKD